MDTIKSKLLDKAIIVLGLAMFAYHMISTQYLFFGTYEHQAIHLAFVFGLIFLDYARRKAKAGGKTFYILLAAIGIACAGYVLMNVVHLENAFGFPTTVDFVIGIILIVLVVEATRLAWGITLPIVSGIFVAYFIWGHLLTGQLYHREFNVEYVVSYLSIGLSGIFGTFLGISANQIFLFVVFGALLGVIRVNEFFIEAGKIAGKTFRGGPGQTAVVSSGFIGMISGAAVANVAITGAFTIPYMKQVGYKSHHAGAIEATASTGGQLMPPVMGAAAFLMASFMGVSYDTVMLAGILPAILYFWGVMLGVQFLAVRANIIAPKEPVDYKLLLRRLPLFGIPLGVLVTMLLMQYSPSVAAFWAIIVAVALAYSRRETRPDFAHLIRCIVGGAIVGAQIGISLAIVGLIAQTLITTGLGNKIAGLVEILSQGNLLIGLLITMVVSIILGCGVPTSAAYTLVAIVVIPIIIRMGVEPIAAHFFAFYFAVISSLTPPVALAALAGAGLAGAPYFKTSLSAAKLAISGFIIPYLIVFNPLLTFNPQSLAFTIGTIIAVPVGMTALTAAIYRCGIAVLTPTEHVLAIASAVLLLGYSVFRHIDSLPIEYPMLIVGCITSVMLATSQFKVKRQMAVEAAG